jgi:hypothetical protein
MPHVKTYKQIAFNSDFLSHKEVSSIAANLKIKIIKLTTHHFCRQQ